MKKTPDLRVILKALLTSIAVALAVSVAFAAVGAGLENASFIPSVGALVATLGASVTAGLICGTDREHGIADAVICALAFGLLVGLCSLPSSNEHSTLLSRIGVPLSALAVPPLCAVFFKPSTNVNRRIKKLRRN